MLCSWIITICTINPTRISILIINIWITHLSQSFLCLQNNFWLSDAFANDNISISILVLILYDDNDINFIKHCSAPTKFIWSLLVTNGINDNDSFVVLLFCLNCCVVYISLLLCKSLFIDLSIYCVVYLI